MLCLPTSVIAARVAHLAPAIPGSCLVPEFVLGILRSLLHLALYITLACATSASCNIAACGNRKQSIAPAEGRRIRNTVMESATKSNVTVIECQNLIMVEISRVLIGRSCRAGGSRASEQGGTGNSGCGHWWAFRLYFVNRPFGDVLLSSLLSLIYFSALCSRSFLLLSLLPTYARIYLSIGLACFSGNSGIDFSRFSFLSGF